MTFKNLRPTLGLVRIVKMDKNFLRHLKAEKHIYRRTVHNCSDGFLNGFKYALHVFYNAMNLGYK